MSWDEEAERAYARGFEDGLASNSETVERLTDSLAEAHWKLDAIQRQSPTLYQILLDNANHERKRDEQRVSDD